MTKSEKAKEVKNILHMLRELDIIEKSPNRFKAIQDFVERHIIVEKR